MNNLISAFGYFMRGVFTIGLAINVAIHWLVILAVLGGVLYLFWQTGGPVFTLALVAVPALLGYRAWRDS